jgi:hypothetical protein
MLNQRITSLPTWVEVFERSVKRSMFGLRFVAKLLDGRGSLLVFSSPVD